MGKIDCSFENFLSFLYWLITYCVPLCLPVSSSYVTTYCWDNVSFSRIGKIVIAQLLSWRFIWSSSLSPLGAQSSARSHLVWIFLQGHTETLWKGGIWWPRVVSGWDHKTFVGLAGQEHLFSCSCTEICLSCKNKGFPILQVFQ